MLIYFLYKWQINNVHFLSSAFFKLLYYSFLISWMKHLDDQFLMCTFKVIHFLLYRAQIVLYVHFILSFGSTNFIVFNHNYFDP